MAARVPITKTDATGSYPLDGETLTLEAADVSDKNDFLMTADDLLIAYNSGSTDPHNVTITSIANAKGRVLHITDDALTTGVTHIYGPFKKLPGWAQTGNKLHFEADHIEIKFAVIKLG